MSAGTSDKSFVYPEGFERFEIQKSGRFNDLPWTTTTGTRMLISMMQQAIQNSMLRCVAQRDLHSDCDAIIEVGSWSGANAYRMAKLVHNSRIYCVDHWKGSDSDITSVISGELGPRTIFQGFCKNMGDLLFDRVFPCVGSSATWASVWPRQVAAIYIDAGHDYESVTQDLNAWWPHILPGGLFVGHDYQMFEGVRNAVHDWHKPEYGALETDEQLWWVWKNS